ncbi:MAG: hypothetical protein KA479_09605 [Saprospiraceae bacterium]|jgi:hypothetical protein|nr:hypothetical protein [Saprospiraceae bacterium]
MASNVRYNMPGPIDVPMETNSGLDLLPTNVTYLALPLKGAQGPRRPEEVPSDSSLSTKAVMEYADPKVTVKLKTGDPENPEIEDTVRFQGGVTAFAPKEIKKNSSILQKLEAEFQASEALVDRINANAKFRKAIDDPIAREAILSVFRDIIAELDAHMPAAPES